MIKKIILGGQSETDQAVLDVVLTPGFPMTDGFQEDGLPGQEHCPANIGLIYLSSFFPSMRTILP